jgi:hypothetical protein
MGEQVQIGCPRYYFCPWSRPSAYITGIYAN